MKRNTAELKEKLIQTGMEEISIHGIEQLSLRTVAAACGVTHGSPYKHFGNKDGYLKVVLARLTQLFYEEVTKDLDKGLSARHQLLQMGQAFVLFAQTNPHIFEALFIKFPFKYMDVTSETILTNVDLPGFNHFKNLVIRLIQEEDLIGKEIDVLTHLWSFILGLSILAMGQIGENFSPRTIQETIDGMLERYIKGGQS